MAITITDITSRPLQGRYSLSISWTDVSAYYYILRWDDSADVEKSGAYIIENIQLFTTYNIIGLEHNTTYYFRVYAYNNSDVLIDSSSETTISTDIDATLPTITQDDILPNLLYRTSLYKIRPILYDGGQEPITIHANVNNSDTLIYIVQEHKIGVSGPPALPYVPVVPPYFFPDKNALYDPSDPITDNYKTRTFDPDIGSFLEVPSDVEGETTLVPLVQSFNNIELYMDTDKKFVKAAFGILPTLETKLVCRSYFDDYTEIKTQPTNIVFPTGGYSQFADDQYQFVIPPQRDIDLLSLQSGTLGTITFEDWMNDVYLDSNWNLEYTSTNPNQTGTVWNIWITDVDIPDGEKFVHEVWLRLSHKTEPTVVSGTYHYTYVSGYSPQ